MTSIITRAPIEAKPLVKFGSLMGRKKSEGISLLKELEQIGPSRNRAPIAISTIESDASMTVSPHVMPSSVTLTKDVMRRPRFDTTATNFNRSTISFAKKKQPGREAISFSKLVNKKLSLLDEGRREYLTRS